MNTLSARRVRFLAVIVAAAFLAVAAWAALASGPMGRAASDQVGIEVTSPGGVVTLEGDLRRP